jgi:hypothetical protein
MSALPGYAINPNVSCHIERFLTVNLLLKHFYFSKLWSKIFTSRSISESWTKFACSQRWQGQNLTELLMCPRGRFLLGQIIIGSTLTNRQVLHVLKTQYLSIFNIFWFRFCNLTSTASRVQKMSKKENASSTTTWRMIQFKSLTKKSLTVMVAIKVCKVKSLLSKILNILFPLKEFLSIGTGFLNP